MILTSMTDYVLEHPASTDYEWQLSKHLNYANFLKQPLKLGMFIPCDENDVPFSDFQIDCLNTNDELKDLRTAFKQAKERVVFEGFEFDLKKSNIIVISNIISQMCFYKQGDITIDATEINTIEDLIQHNLTITETAVKKYGI